MRRFLLSLITSCLFTACATAPAAIEHKPITLTLEAADDAELWKSAAQTIRQTTPEYDIHVTEQSRDRHFFNRIAEDRMCIEPVTHYDFAGNLVSFTPVYCTSLDRTQPDKSLGEALTAYQNRIVSRGDDESEPGFRQRILQASTPTDPLCFSVFPDLFASASNQSLQLEENYLIACANRIEDDSTSSVLASWLRLEAALLSSHNTFIARAYRSAIQDTSFESMVYGIAIEGYSEFLSKRMRQAEITLIDALRKSDDERLFLLSRQNALLLSFIVSTSETMTGQRLTAIVKALAPRQNWPAEVTDFRNILQLKVCRMSVIIPDVTSSLVAACLPWLEVSRFHQDDFEMALMLIEHGIYGSQADEPIIAPEVMDWLRNLTLSGETAQARREFAQRIADHPRLTDADRQTLKSF